MPKQYPKDFRDRTVRLVVESREDYETEWAAIQVVASRLNVRAETARNWMHRSEIDVELATLEWVWWINNQGLHSELDYQTPAEIEAAYYAENHPALATATHGKP